MRVAFESDRESRSGYVVDLSESEIFAVEMIGKEPEFTGEKNSYIDMSRCCVAMLNSFSFDHI